MSVTDVHGRWGYHPVPTDFESFLDVVTFDEALIIGPGLGDLVGRVASVRLKSGQVELPVGVYWFSGAGLSSIMQVTHGGPSGPSQSATADDVAAVPSLQAAASWFEHLWEESQEVPNPLYAPGSDVIVSQLGQDGIIRSRRFTVGGWTYKVFVSGGHENIREADLHARPQSDDASTWVTEKPDSPARFAATLTRAKLSLNFRDTLYSFSATRTVFRPYQFKPVLKLLNTETLRLLIADEVGLGKTIEAGLVWTELEARRQADRVLVVCPSSLVGKWQREMEERFSFELMELTTDRLEQLIDRLEQGSVPARAAYVCSIERLRSWEGLERANDLGLQFDLVVVDEAHAFRNSDTKSHELGEFLSEWADAFVMLSATPVNLRNRDLFNLLGLLVPGEFDDLESLTERLEPNAVLNRITESLTDLTVSNEQRRRWLLGVRSSVFGQVLAARPDFDLLKEVLSLDVLGPAEAARVRRLCAELHALSGQITRTRKVEVQENKARRRAMPVPVAWSEHEHEFYDEFRSWCVERAAAADMPLHFAMQMPLRLAGSCLPEAAAQVLTWGAVEIDAEAEIDDVANASRAVSASSAVPPSARLIDLAQRLNEDTKFDRFSVTLDSILDQGRQVLVFTFSKKTLKYLRNRLSADARVAVLSGAVDRRERDKIMAAFRAGEFNVLIATKVASEGLDFEFCSAVINYDLPWNPMEVEQRIGRIDRIGQQEDVLSIYNFHTPGTIETDILERVYARIEVFTHAIGHLEPIIESEWRRVQEVLFDPNLSPEERDRKENEVALALAENSQALEDLQESAPTLLSSDGAEIDGLDEELLATGRYVGQQELALLVEDWVTLRGGAVDRSDTVLRVRGNADMAAEIQALVRTGERIGREVESIAGAVRAEQWITLSLDQDLARTSGMELLTANHPLTRAALQVPGYRQSRYTILQMAADAAGAQPGLYLVLLATAEWSGVRPVREVWSVAVDVDRGTVSDEAVGNAVMAGLASGSLRSGPWITDRELGGHAEHAALLLANRADHRREELEHENRAFVLQRETSYQQVHERRMASLSRALQTSLDRGSAKGARLAQSRIAKQEARLEAQLADLARGDSAAMTTKDLAVCLVMVK